MKKTFSININGLLFNIDDDAFERLNDYLKNLKKHFKSTEGGEDIVNDIEARIAELLKSRTKDAQQIISLNDIHFVIETLGQPFEMDEENAGTGSKKTHTKHTKKRIFRDPDNQFIAGVSSGLGAYFSIDPIIVRLLFVVFTFIGGVGAIAYLTIWLLAPIASTTSEKLEMEGEVVDIHTIEKKVRAELDLLGAKFENFTNEAGDVFKKKRESSNNGINRFGKMLYNFFKIVFRVIGILIGLIFLLVGIALSITFVATYLGLTPAIHFDEFAIHGISFPAFLDHFIISTSYPLALNISLFLLIFIPIVALLYNGVRLIFNLGRQKEIGVAAIILWTVASVVAFTLAIETFKQFNTESNQVLTNTFDSIQSDTLNIAIFNAQYYKEVDQNTGTVKIVDNKVTINSNDVFYGNPQITFSKAEGEFFELVVRSSARGEYSEEASNRLKNTHYYFELKENTLYLEPYFTLLHSEKWRNQRVLFQIKVPEGKTVYLDPTTRRYFRWQYWHHSQRTMSGKYWIMTDDDLEENE